MSEIPTHGDVEPRIPPRRGRPVTRADVARYASVSTAVVSYVVNGGPRPVAAATRERVLGAVRLLGYRPNASARALRTGATKLIGVVLPEIANPLFAELALSIEQYAGELGFAVLVTNSASDPTVERRNIRNLAARQVDGMILVTVMGPSDLVGLPIADIPTVLLNTFEETPGFASIGIDAFDGASRGVRHLIEHGHPSVALVIGRHSGDDVELRERGWLAATRDAGLPDGPIAREEFSRAGGHRAGHGLFGGLNPPTAVFCSSDWQAIGVFRALYELGLRVPEDVAVVSFDGTEASEYTNPQLTVVRQPVAAMAADAISRVVEMGKPNDRPHRPDVGGAFKVAPSPGAQADATTLTTSTHRIAHTADLIIRRSCGCHPELASRSLQA